MSGTAFEGFPDAAFAWFDGLERDNSKAYFTEHREIYDGAVRGALEQMLEELAAELGGELKMFRQNRDVRFSADKSPYKTTTYGLIVNRPESLPSLYAQLSSHGLFCGSGYHMLAPDQLERFRAAVADETHGPEAMAAVAELERSGLEGLGESLKTALS